MRVTHRPPFCLLRTPTEPLFFRPRNRPVPHWIQRGSRRTTAVPHSLGSDRSHPNSGLCEIAILVNSSTDSRNQPPS